MPVKLAITLLVAVCLLASKSDGVVAQLKPSNKLDAIARFFEFSNDAEPAILGRALKHEEKDRRTSGGVSIDGTTVTIYHTLERTSDGLRLKTSNVYDQILFDHKEDGTRDQPGKPLYRVVVAEIELKLAKGGERVEGFLRNISNSQFDPVGWSVEISNVEITEHETGRGVLTMKTRQIGTSGRFAKGGSFTPSTFEGETVLKLTEDGKLVQTVTSTDYDVDPKTGSRSKVEPDPKNRIENPVVRTAREQ